MIFWQHVHSAYSYGFRTNFPISVSAFDHHKDSLLNAPHSKKERMEEDCKVHEEVTMLNVVEIVFDVFMNQKSPIATQLPKAGNAGLYLKPLSMMIGVLLHDERHLRAGADQ